MRASLSPEFEGDAVRVQDFFCRRVAEVSPSLTHCFGVPEPSAMLGPTNPWNRVSAMPIESNASSPDALLQVCKGVATALLPTIEDDEQLSRF
jgi:hypothetical protein